MRPRKTINSLKQSLIESNRREVIMKLLRSTKPKSLFAALEDVGEKYGGKYSYNEVAEAYKDLKI